jgi:hypothetical protein
VLTLEEEVRMKRRSNNLGELLLVLLPPPLQPVKEYLPAVHPEAEEPISGRSQPK